MRWNAGDGADVHGGRLAQAVRASTCGQGGIVVSSGNGNSVAIAKNNDVVTLINVFTVRPGDQDRVVDLLEAATEQTMKKLPGFVSASIHKSLDGVRVANYAQWQSREAFEAMSKNPDARAHMGPLMEIAQADFHLYEVAGTFTVS
jgi:quinol monooxygenase YgiN